MLIVSSSKMLVKKCPRNNNLVVQKTDKGNSVVLVDKDIYVNHTENILKDNTKFEKANIKTSRCEI